MGGPADLGCFRQHQAQSPIAQYAQSLCVLDVLSWLLSSVCWHACAFGLQALL
jgi:hypothetical protein